MAFLTSDSVIGSYVYIISKLHDVIICCYGDIVYHKHWLHFFKKIAGVENMWLLKKKTLN